MMYAAIRLKGHAGINKAMGDTLEILNLRRVNTCVVVPERSLGMLKAVQSYITYGEISPKTLEALVSKAGLGGKPEELSKAVKGISEGKAKAVFRLPPPSKGYKSVKKHFPKGDLGYRGEKMNELIARMI